MKTLVMAFERNGYVMVAGFIFSMMLFMQCCGSIALAADLSVSKTEGMEAVYAEFTTNQLSNKMDGELNYETPQKFYNSVLKDLTTEQTMKNGRRYLVDLVTVDVSTFDDNKWNAIEKIVKKEGKLKMVRDLDVTTGKDIYMFSLKNNSVR